MIQQNRELVGFVPLGKGKAKKFFKKIGKFTRPFTTAAAKMFLPASLVDSAARFDPTKKGAAASIPQAIQQAAALNLAPAPAPAPGFFDKSHLARNVGIFGGGAVVLGVLVYGVSKRRQAAAI